MAEYKKNIVLVNNFELFTKFDLSFAIVLFKKVHRFLYYMLNISTRYLKMPEQFGIPGLL